MLLHAGQWLGKGSLLVEGNSLGDSLEVEAKVEQDDGGFTIYAMVSAKDRPAAEYSVRIASNDVGTYTLRVQSGADNLTGSAKLDSPPNLGLLWNDAQTVYATFSLFAINDGYGFRGFVRDGNTTYTWEIALGLKQNVIKGDNVVSLGSHRPRRR